MGIGSPRFFVDGYLSAGQRHLSLSVSSLQGRTPWENIVVALEVERKP
jgi:hypothetical protein